MILPSKHISLSESLLGLAGILLTFLAKRPYTLDELWQEYSKVNKTRDVFPAYHSFDNVVMAINLLYLIGAININTNGEIIKYETT